MQVILQDHANIRNRSGKASGRYQAELAEKYFWLWFLRTGPLLWWSDRKPQGESVLITFPAQKVIRTMLWWDFKIQATFLSRLIHYNERFVLGWWEDSSWMCHDDLFSSEVSSRHCHTMSFQNLGKYFLVSLNFMNGHLVKKWSYDSSGWCPDAFSIP